MTTEPPKTPFRGVWLLAIILILPSLILTGVFYVMISRRQPQFGEALNWASAKALGFGIGVLFHIACWIAGTFSKDLQIVKNRMKELVSDITVSVRSAFTWYWEDMKSYGVGFLIEILIIILNALVFFDAASDFAALYW